MLISGDPQNHGALYAGFRWRVPQRFNIGTACSDTVAARTPDAPAIIDVASDAEGSTVRHFTFSELAKLSNRFANVLTALGVSCGDRVAVMAPQSIQTAAAHLGIYKCGAIAVPMAIQFGPQAIAYRLGTAEPKAFLVHAQALDRIEAAIAASEVSPALIVSDAPEHAKNGFWQICAQARDTFDAVATEPDDPAMMLFTSGTTGQPKAALHGHCVLAGHMPGIQISQDMMPKAGDRMWTPSDWAWAGGLLNALLPSLALGVGVVAARTAKFDPHWAAGIIGNNAVRNVFMPATALRLMLGAGLKRSDGLANLRSIGSAGEALGAKTLALARELWDLEINEFYGQTECNTVLGASRIMGIQRPGSMGKPTPGHRVAVLGPENQPLAAGETGQLAIARPDPVMFLEYWNDPDATRAAFAGDWLLTGDQAYYDADGYFHFVGRNDDVITSSGYRIGPTEIEDVLTAHPAVSLAAVVGLPDPIRTETVTAFVVTHDTPDDEDGLRQTLKEWVRTRLSAHQQPRDIRFVDDIPVTESGKIIRRHFRTSAENRD